MQGVEDVGVHSLWAVISCPKRQGFSQNTSLEDASLEVPKTKGLASVSTMCGALHSCSDAVSRKGGQLDLKASTIFGSSAPDSAITDLLEPHCHLCIMDAMLGAAFTTQQLASCPSAEPRGSQCAGSALVLDFCSAGMSWFGISWDPTWTWVSRLLILLVLQKAD